MLLLADVVEVHQIGVVLRQEGVERFGKVRRVDKPLMQILRELLLVNPIKEECATDTAYIFGNQGVFGNRRLRPLSRNGSIDGKDDAAVGLFEVQVQTVTHDEQAIAVTVADVGSIHVHAVALKIQVVLVLGPEAVVVGLTAAGIGRQRSLSNPLHTVETAVEQEGNAEFREKT